MKGKDYKMYGWVVTDQTWKILDQSKVENNGIGERGRLFKMDHHQKRSRKVFQQKRTPQIN